MNVLKNNYNNCIEKKVLKKKEMRSYPRNLICENCDSELEYEESDMRMGEYGCMFVDCPLCNYGNILEDNENNITLTVDNIEFPIHFHHISVETGAFDCFEKYFKEYLKKAIDYFRANKDEYFFGGWISGNFYIMVHRYEGDENYDVIVSKDFYNMYIPFEQEDY